MGELVADSRFGPGEVPADAMLVVRWDPGPPGRWVTVGVGTGYDSLAECRDDAYFNVPGLEDQWVEVTKFGGQARQGGLLRVRRTRERVVVDEEPPPVEAVEDAPVAEDPIAAPVAEPGPAVSS